jgi:hypothetical protein
MEKLYTSFNKNRSSISKAEIGDTQTARQTRMQRAWGTNEIPYSLKGGK